MARIFNLNLIKLTPKGDLNFIGVVVKYFEIINARWEESTKDKYYHYYIDFIFPLIDKAKPIIEYNTDYLDYLMILIIEKWKHNTSSLESIYRHLLVDPCDRYFEEYAPNRNPFWGSSFKAIEKDISIDLQTTKVIKKSFTSKEEGRASAYLFSDYKTENGEIIGLTLMYSTGSRLNETCGTTFGDIKTFKDYPDCHYIILGHVTTKLHSRDLKAGGKTVNSPRRIPLLPKIYEFLIERKKYIESQITFPYTNSDGVTFNNIDDLPIACKKNNYTKNLMSDELSVAGRMFFKNVLEIRESDITNITQEIHGNNDIEEKDATTYLFRRNMATHLFNLDFTNAERQYFMGHKIEDPLIVRRDFNDEDMLYIVYQKLSRHPYLTTAQNEK